MSDSSVMSPESNLYVCRSPLQLLNCVEAREAYASKGARNVLLAFHRSPKDKLLMEKILQADNAWSAIHFGPLYPTRKQVSVLTAHAGKGRVYDRCFVGDYTHIINFFLNRLDCRKFVMIDDGTATLERAELIASDRIHRTTKNNRPMSRLSFAWNELLGLSPRYLRSAELFTVYDVSHHLPATRIRPNTYAYLSTLARAKTRSDEVWFIGSPWPSLMTAPDRFPQLLTEAISRLPAGKVVYIPHRKENLVTLQDLSNRLGFELRPLDSILELHLLLGDRLPCGIASLGSSAIDTLWLLFRIETTIFRVPQAEIVDIADGWVKSMYENFAATGIAVFPIVGDATPAAPAH